MWSEPRGLHQSTGQRTLVDVDLDRTVIGQLDELGVEWCQESGFDPSANLSRAVATPLLHAMCPPEHLSRALEVLDMFWLEVVEQRPPSIRETAARYLIATLHVAAAMTAGLFGKPGCVPDRVAAQAKLLEFNQQLVERLTRRSSTGEPTQV